MCPRFHIMKSSSILRKYSQKNSCKLLALWCKVVTCDGDSRHGGWEKTCEFCFHLSCRFKSTKQNSWRGWCNMIRRCNRWTWKFISTIQVNLPIDSILTSQLFFIIIIWAKEQIASMKRLYPPFSLFSFLSIGNIFTTSLHVMGRGGSNQVSIMVGVW